MENTLTLAPKKSIAVPVIALTLYAVSSGYLMSLIPLMLSHYGLENQLASWLASAFYAGLLIGAVFIEPLVKQIGHRNAFVLCLACFMVTILAMPTFAYSSVWLAARLVAGIAVAGVFVVVESWLMSGDEASRAKRLGIYMAALYGGASIGQLGIGTIGVEGAVPFIAILTLLLMAVLVLMFGNTQQPESHNTSALSFKQIAKLNHAAIIGCIISGLTLGAIYGLMPVELTQRGIETSDVGSLMALVILGGMAIQPVVPWLSKFLGRTLLMAMFCFLGVFSIGLTAQSDSQIILAVCLFMLGMATFALYPIAINLGCEGLDESFIVSATQVMLFSYSVGSVAGPLIANSYMGSKNGLLSYLFISLMATCIYMLLVSVKGKKQAMVG
ncbi:MFS transporter [Vibrio clamense]|uniref:MFS transporter n=1 Tax=Vibrio clamense TaxID=2910254 RepID=UPI003D1A5A7C